MRTNKVVRGKPLYIYRGSQYLEMPDKCVVKWVDYDEKTGKSLVYCRKPSKAIELICSLVMITCVLANVLFIKNMVLGVRYNSLSVYYDGALFVNVLNDEDNKATLEVQLLDGSSLIYECELEPGEYLISVPIENVSDSYILVLSYSLLGNVVTERYPITVQRRD